MQDEREQLAVRLCAAAAGDGSSIDALLADRPGLVSVYVTEPRDWGDEMWLAIHHAAEHGRVEAARKLLDAGASADSRTRFRTPMHARETAVLIAARHGHAALLKLLLDRHGQVEVRDALHQSPLTHAAGNGHAEAVELLIDRGAMLDAEDDQQRTPLHHAIRGGHLEVAHRLILAGADTNHRCPKEPAGYTPLHRCVSAGEAMRGVARLLVERGADTAAADPRYGKTAADLAADANLRSYLDLLN